MKKESKKRIYLTLWYVVGAESLILFTLLFRLYYEQKTNDYPMDLTWGVIFALAFIIGVVLGHFAGPIAWRKIYVEGIRGKKYLI